MLVDWDTIAIFTCVNPDCLTKLDDSCWVQEEFAYIQISEDFSNVKYGSAEQISQQNKQREQELQKIEEEQKAEIEKEMDTFKKEAEQQADAGKKKNKKNKKKNKPENEEDSTQIQEQVQEELGDLISQMSLGSKPEQNS